LTAPKHVLVTGATGVVGVEVANRLAGAGHAVLALVHRNQSLVLNNGKRLSTVGGPDPAGGTIACVRGDVTKPRLGLDAADYRRLQSSIGMIVHCAAIVDFGRAPAVYQSVNVDGTAAVLALAQAAPDGPPPLVHVSTAYVAGERRGTVLEEELDVGQRFANAYEESKCRAEGLVREAVAGGLPAAIVRPSIVVGATRTGAIRDFKTIYAVLKTLTEGRVRSIPAYYGATLDLVPVDYVADVVAHAALRFDDAVGKTLHAVSAAPLTLRDFSDVLAEYPPFHVPRFVPPETFDVERLPLLERKYYDRIVSLYESYFTRRVAFDNAATLEFMGRAPAMRLRPFLRRLLDYCMRVRFLGRPLPDVGTVLADLHSSDRPGGDGASADGVVAAT
jgi:thioester reductase-like protein